ncbi:hypothetical protein DFP72DRAFT_1084554 [Ephemerocybe angulata]|uniref:Nucleoplasmin-like domain-containing protein n=1 Tax=Ephemerocybe angulata TaxID=980116 RepID=A0A8H6H696_9AGAR|nr:hypothetical protein DFP72DRAFT_1084554 [Tulosesus angulatus]
MAPSDKTGSELSSNTHTQEHWAKVVGPGESWKTSVEHRLLITTVCIGFDFEIPTTATGRGCLMFGYASADKLHAIASLTKDVCEQVKIDLTLDAGDDYRFEVLGPFPIHMIGYYI